MTLIWILLGIVVLIFLLYLLCLRCDRRRDWKKLRGWRYAHRGYHDKPRIPENSIPAFRRAVQCGFGAELDVHLMKDGHLAVIHDASLLRTAGADVEIEDLTAEDLANYTLEGTEHHIPLLEEVLPIFAGKAPLIIELKAERGNADALTAAGIARMGLWTLWDVPCTYPLLERMKLEVAAAGGVVRDAEYGADITLRTAFPAGTAETFQLRLTELSAGSLTMTAAGEEFLPGPREEAN